MRKTETVREVIHLWNKDLLYQARRHDTSTRNLDLSRLLILQSRLRLERGTKRFRMKLEFDCSCDLLQRLSNK